MQKRCVDLLQGSFFFVDQKADRLIFSSSSCITNMPNLQQGQILMAPIKLYREILRSHRSLPPAMRAMGDDYVKAEFKRHKDIENPAHIVGFVSQWQT